MSANVFYYTNAGGDNNWETLTNWNTQEDGSGDNPTSIPWVRNSDSGLTAYPDYNLIDTTSQSQLNINSTIEVDVTGTCDCQVWFNQLDLATDGGTVNINGGTWTGSLIEDIYGAIVNGGNFYAGAYEHNTGTINGGNFNCGGFYNYGAGIINGGTNSTYGVYNYQGASINGGILSGGGLINGSEGSDDAEAYNLGTSINNAQITGGNTGNYALMTNVVDSGGNFQKRKGAQIIGCSISGGNYSDWSIQGCYLGSDGVFVDNNINYSYSGSALAVPYPAPPAARVLFPISQVLGLPFPIQL